MKQPTVENSFAHFAAHGYICRDKEAASKLIESLQTKMLVVGHKASEMTYEQLTLLLKDCDQLRMEINSYFYKPNIPYSNFKD